MAKKKAVSQHMDRISASLAASFPAFDQNGQHGYELSSSFMLAEKRRIMGTWQVTSHQVDGTDYPRHFINTMLHGAELLEPIYQASYLFYEGICIRRSSVSGTLLLPNGHSRYCFNLRLSLQWVLEPQTLLIRPLMGYQYASLDDQPAAVKELADSGEWLRIAYRFDGEELLTIDGGDEKRLRREE